jgi:hypothetical protein
MLMLLIPLDSLASSPSSCLPLAEMAELAEPAEMSMFVFMSVCESASAPQMALSTLRSVTTARMQKIEVAGWWLVISDYRDVAG